VSVQRPSFLQPTPEREWNHALAAAQALDGHGQVAGADSLLGAFALRYPRSRGAAEANYWRALFRFDSMSVESAVPLLRAYLASPAPRSHDVEANIMLRIALLTRQLDTMVARTASRAALANAVATAAAARADSADDRAAAATQAMRAAADGARAKDDSVARLKSQLATANDELARIKKRLAEASKKPPGASPR